MTRNAEICRKNNCSRFERYGTPPVNNTNYLCLHADAFRFEKKEDYEKQEVPSDCPFKNQHQQEEISMDVIQVSKAFMQAVPVVVNESVDLTGKNVGLGIIDAVRGFCTPGAGNLAPKVADPRIDKAVDEIDFLAKMILQKSGKVFVERDVHSEDTPEYPYLEHCKIGSGEELLVEKLQWLMEVNPNVTHAVKHCINALIGSMRFGGGNGVIEFMVNNQLQVLVLSGFCTDICVMEYALTLMSVKNMRQLQFLEKVIVVPNACATYDLPLEVAVNEIGDPSKSHPADIFHHMGLTLMQKSGIILANEIIM